MRTLSRFRALSHRTRVLLLTAAALQIGARLVLAVRGLPQAVRLAQRIGARTVRPRDLPTLVWALGASAPRVGGTCLTQALAALALGASASRSLRLVIGVRPGAGVPEFHAWAEIEGVMFPATPGLTSFERVTTWS